MDPYALESDAQAAAAAAESREGEELASATRTRILLALVLGVLAAGGLAFAVVRLNHPHRPLDARAP